MRREDSCTFKQFISKSALDFLVMPRRRNQKLLGEKFNETDKNSEPGASIKEGMICSASIFPAGSRPQLKKKGEDVDGRGEHAAE